MLELSAGTVNLTKALASDAPDVDPTVTVYVSSLLDGVTPNTLKPGTAPVLGFVADTLKSYLLRGTRTGGVAYQ